MIKNNLGIDIDIVPKVSGYNMQKHDDHLKLWTHALAIYDSSKFAFALKFEDLDLMFQNCMGTGFKYLIVHPKVT